MVQFPRPGIVVGLRGIHAVITRGLGVAKGRSDTFSTEGAPDAATARGFATYVATLSAVINAHHLTEDEVGFPYFRDLLPDMPYEKLAEQHQLMLPLIQHLADVAVGLRESASPMSETSAFDDIHQTASGLTVIWAPHIAVEESYLSVDRLRPLMEPSESMRLAKLFAEHMQKKAHPDSLVVPFLLFNLKPEERRVFTDLMPETVTKELVPVVWKEQWQPMQPFLLET